ncbi:MAG: hypothetical protein JW798_10540 [Prolixibacteraceae bacterium]|nr:hypothetical protein [Prolixibacteraceae bacterium]
MILKKILAALLTIIGTGGLIVIYGIVAVFFFMGGISRVFSTKRLMG